MQTSRSLLFTPTYNKSQAAAGAITTLRGLPIERQLNYASILAKFEMASKPIASERLAINYLDQIKGLDAELRSIGILNVKYALIAENGHSPVYCRLQFSLIENPLNKDAIKILLDRSLPLGAEGEKSNNPMTSLLTYIHGYSRDDITACDSVTMTLEPGALKQQLEIRSYTIL